MLKTIVKYLLGELLDEAAARATRGAERARVRELRQILVGDIGRRETPPPPSPPLPREAPRHIVRRVRVVEIPFFRPEGGQ